jgi:hypothetical protein
MNFAPMAQPQLSFNKSCLIASGMLILFFIPRFTAST